MEEDQQFCLRWNNHQSTLISVFDTLLENGTLVDCTLAAEGKFLKAHKVVLSACSPYFATLLSEQYDKHPIFILKDVKYQELRAMMDYMYRGEVNISQDQLAALLKAAESLQIKGLSDNRGGAGSGSKAGEPQKHSTTGHHVPGKMTNIGHMGAGYTLEQAKRARIGPSSIDSQDIGGSREGSSSPSRRRKKIRRRSVDNVMGDNHENSNSSQNMQINSSVTGTGAITTSIVPSGAVAQAASGNQIQTQTNKKTDNLSKLDQGVSVSTINPTASATANVSDEHDEDNSTNKKDHLQSAVAKKDKEVSGSGTSSSDIVIEPKSEYDDGNDEPVEDLTLDDEMALDELDQTAGPSHGGEGSSQGYAQWQVDRSHDESYMAQDVQQRDPQDLSKKLIPKLKPNPVATVIKQPLKKILLNNNVVPVSVSKQPQRISITQMSDMLLDLYKTTNTTAKTPKNEPIRQTSPSSADGAESKNTNENKCPKEMKAKNFNNNYSMTAKKQKVSVIQPPMMNNSTPVAAAFAAALFRDGYNNFHNQLRAQELLKCHQQQQQQQPVEPPIKIKQEQVSPTKAQFLQNFLLKDRRVSDNGGGSSGMSGTMGTSDEEQFTEGDDDSKYSGFDDIHLIEGSKTMHYGSNSNDYMSDESQHKFLLANNLKNLEFSLGGGPAGAQHYTNLAMTGDEPMYECRHCGKRYRWKSTLRRHENVECGGKEPSHQCPYCPYKSKQRGNLGVHVRKHHSNLPQLQSKRRSKYSIKIEDTTQDNNITI